MKVHEAIKLLQGEDPNSTLVVVLSRYRHQSLRELVEDDRGVFNELEFDGNDRSFGTCGAVVLIADRDSVC